MGNTFKPGGVLTPMVTYTVNDCYNVYGRNAAQADYALFGDTNAGYSETGAWYWYGTGYWVDMTIDAPCHIWAIGSNDGYWGSFYDLKIQKWNGSAFEDYTQTSTPTNDGRNWNKIHSDLPAGRYKFSQLTASAVIHGEWYLEPAPIVKFLVKDGNDIKKYDGGWSTLGTGTPTEAMFLGSNMLPTDVITNLASLSNASPEVLTYHDTNSSIQVTEEKVVGPKVIEQIDDIVLTSVENIDSFTLIAPETGAGAVRVIVSWDSGTTWKSYYSAAWNTIDKTNLSEVKTNGMTVSTFNALTSVEWADALTAGKIKFAYYLEIADITDTAEIDRLSSQFDMKGKWKNATSSQYTYSYTNALNISLSITEDGDYKINY